MISLRIVFRTCLLFSLALPAFAQSHIEWQLTRDNELVSHARSLLQQAALPHELTQLLYRVDLDISDNDVRQKVQIIWYYPSPESVERNGTEVIAFNQRNDLVRVLTLSSVDSNGQVQPFDPSSVQYVDSDRYNSFTDTKEAVLVIPGLKRGSVSVLEYEIVTDKTGLEADWFDIYYPQNRYPRQQFELNVRWDVKNQPMQWNSSSTHVQCNESDNRLRCTGAAIPSAQEDKGVVWRDVLGQITLGGQAQWHDVITQARRAFKQASEDQSGSDEILSDLLQGAVSKEDQIRRIHEFVSREIRYMSFSKQGNTITPHSIASVINNRYGDCKDKSALLVDLLGKVNIDAHPVLVATQRERKEHLVVPSMGYFDHMVVCLNYQKTPYCLDATDTETHWKKTPSWIQGKVALPLLDNASPKNVKRSLYRWQFNVDTHIDFDDEGGQIERQSRTYMGEYAGFMRGLLGGKTHEKQKEVATQQYQDIVSSSATPVFTLSGVEGLSPQVSVFSETEYEPFVDPDKALSAYDYDSWLRYELRESRLEGRHYDTHFPGIKLHSQIAIDVKDIWVLKNVGAELNLSHRFGRMTRRIVRPGSGRVIYTTDLVIPEQAIPKEKIEAFNRFLSVLSEQTTIRYGGVVVR